MARAKRPRWPLSGDHAFGVPVVSPRYHSGSAAQDRASIAHLQRSLGVKATGLFDGSTQEAVKAWQESKGLYPDGLVTRKTWSRIVDPA